MKLFSRSKFLSAATVMLVAVLFSAAASAAETQVEEVNTEAAAKLVDEKKVTVLDIRTPAEFSEGHIKGAENHDFTDDNFKQSLEKLDKEKSYLVHCEAGGRSAKSLKTLKSLGFKNIYHYSGGMSEWREKGRPVEK